MAGLIIPDKKCRMVEMYVKCFNLCRSVLLMFSLKDLLGAHSITEAPHVLTPYSKPLSLAFFSGVFLAYFIDKVLFSFRAVDVCFSLFTPCSENV